jgi:hypothetical protein
MVCLILVEPFKENAIYLHFNELGKIVSFAILGQNDTGISGVNITFAARF